MTQRTEDEIRAEIKRLRWLTSDEFVETNIYVNQARALEWVLSAPPSPVAGDDEIVEAAIVAMVRVGFERDGRPPLSRAYRPDEDDMESMRAALAVARPLIERAARASADAEIAELRASLAKAEKALVGVKPYLEVATISKWRDALLADVVAALYHVRKARG